MLNSNPRIKVGVYTMSWNSSTTALIFPLPWVSFISPGMLEEKKITTMKDEDHIEGIEQRLIRSLCVPSLGNTFFLSWTAVC